VFFLMVVVIAVVVFGVAAVASGHGGTLAPHREPAPVPLREGPVDAEALAAVRFPVVVRGYRMDVVDAVLDTLGAALAERDARIAELSARPGHASDQPRAMGQAASDAPGSGWVE
jgi:DivIVA domain-containing protein